MAGNDNKDEKKGSNIGCLIVVVLFVIGSLALTFMKTSKEEFADMGYLIMSIAGLVVAYFILKRLGILGNSNTSSEPDSGDGDNKSFLKGCLIVLGILLFFGIPDDLIQHGGEIALFPMVRMRGDGSDAADFEHVSFVFHVHPVEPDGRDGDPVDKAADMDHVRIVRKIEFGQDMFKLCLGRLKTESQVHQVDHGTVFVTSERSDLHRKTPSIHSDSSIP